jgi:hypothetical protein
MIVDLRRDLRSVTDDMIRTWAPNGLWQVAQPLIPVPTKRPQGGGKRRADDRAVLAAIVYLVQGRLFGVSCATAHRRFTEGTAAGLGNGCITGCWISTRSSVRLAGRGPWWPPRQMLRLNAQPRPLGRSGLPICS